MKLKNVFTLIALVLFACFLLSCERSHAKALERIPAGFVKLSTAGGNLYNGGLHYTIGVSQIAFFDIEGICIYQTELTNDDFIITYEKEYYIYQGKYTELVDMATDVRVVETKPEGFIHLNEGLRPLKNGLHYVLGKTEILFLDADEVCIYQTRFNNSDFFVLYENKYYVNKEKFSELVDQAAVVSAQRKKIYKMGETVYLRGFESSYAVLLHQANIEPIPMEKPFVALHSRKVLTDRF